MIRLICAAICAALSSFLLTGAVMAAPVTLTLSDGSFNVTGEILEYDGDTYVIDTQFGILSMARETTRCIGTSCPKTADQVPVIAISGADSLGQTLLPALIEDFARSREYDISVSTDSDGTIVVKFLAGNSGRNIAIFRLKLSTTAQGIADMLFGKSQFVMARRALTEGEHLAITSRFAPADGAGVRTTVMGWENLFLYTNLENAAEQVTVSDLIGMTQSAPAVWPDGTPVTLRGDFDSVTALRQQLGFVTATPALNVGNDANMGMLRVSANKALPLKPVQLVATCNQITDDHGMDQEVQPLKAPLYLVAAPVNIPPVARDFWAFLVTASAQETISKVGYASRTPTETLLNGEGSMLIDAILNTDDTMRAVDLRDAVRELYGYGRLSLTFRFQEGTRVLDEESRTNLGFLASLLKEGRFKERDIIFAGFSDNQGSAAGNINISLDRAQALRGTIRNLMGDDAPIKGTFRTKGFGEGLPLACNDTEWGQHQNRRVEIWVK